MTNATEIKDIQTPALLVDMDIMEANLETMAAFFRDKPCGLRPHFKNTKCIALAKRQMAAGAIGITTATLGETASLVSAGIPSILIANEIAGEANLRQLIALAADTAIIVAVDNETVVNDIARLAAGKKNKLALVVDIDLGLKRCGVQPGLPVLELAQKILAKQLIFCGIMGYEGHLQRMLPVKETLPTRTAALQQLLFSKKLLAKNSIPSAIVSTGGTGTCYIAGNTQGITEVQAGNYLLMDDAYAPYAPDFKPALTVLTTVISVTPGERYILNAGIKEISAERGLPSLKNAGGGVLKALHAEHGMVEIQGAAPVNVGDVVALPVYYSDGTVNLHRKMFGIRNNKVEEIFTIG